MSQGKIRKKYAAVRLPERLPALRGEADARGLKEAASQTMLEESVKESREESAGDQERRQAILAGLIARAEALVPDPPDLPTRKTCREALADESIVKKFRQQGFNL